MTQMTMMHRHRGDQQLHGTGTTQMAMHHRRGVRLRRVSGTTQMEMRRLQGQQHCEAI